MKSVALNVAANNDHPGGRGPIYADGSFRYVPIPEEDPTVKEPTYSDLALEDVRPPSVHNSATHFDPEFPEIKYGKNYTYGDRWRIKTRELAKLEKEDILFFYATLDYVDKVEPEYEWINTDWGAYIIGHFTLERGPITKDEFELLSESDKERLKTNAHVRRREYDAELLILGDPKGSQLYDKPIPLSGTTGVKANRIVTSLSEDSGAGPWYRRPLLFDESGTEKILAAQRSGEHGELLHTEEFLDFPEAKPFTRFVSLPENWYRLWRFLERSVLTREARLLGSFVYIAGGNNQEIVEAVLDTARTLDGAVAKREELQPRLNDLYESKNLRNSNHRKYLGGYTDAEGKGGDVMEALETFHHHLEPTFEGFLEAIRREENPFNTGLNRLRKGVASYGRLSAFDQLELWQHLLELDWLTPSTLRKAYVATAGPKRGFERVFGVSMDDLNDDEVDYKLQMLHDYAVEELNMNPSRVVYEIESALCNYQKEDAELDEDPARDTAEPC